MKVSIKLYIIVLFISLARCEAQQKSCVPRDYGESSFVCVCNSTYCDDLPSPLPIPPQGQYLLYTTDQIQHRFQPTTHFFTPIKQSRDGRSLDVSLDFDDEYQTIMGWGGAFTDSAALNILALSPQAQDLLLGSYFSSGGLLYNLGRVNMGGCDFSWRTYTYVDTVGDVQLNTFELQPEDLQYKIPIIHRAMEMSPTPIKLLASPWTAPPWMKTNNDYAGMGQLLPEMYQPWANYFVKFLDAYAAQDLTFWGLTAQNEPVDGNVPGFPFSCMGWTAEQQKLWIADNLGPTLEESGYGDILLMIMDDQRYNLPRWPKEVLINSSAAQYVDGIAVHWYGDDYSSPDRLDQTHTLFPDYFILATEACEGDGPLEQEVLLGSWHRLETYAHDIIEDMNHWVTGWIDWNLALDLTGGPNWAQNYVDAPILVNQDADEFYKNPMFYAMGHFSKFVHEGAIRVGFTNRNSTTTSLQYTAFKNTDGTNVFIVLNRSDNEEDMTVQINGRGIMSLTVTPHSLHTAVWL